MQLPKKDDVKTVRKNKKKCGKSFDPIFRQVPIILYWRPAYKNTKYSFLSRKINEAKKFFTQSLVCFALKIVGDICSSGHQR